MLINGMVLGVKNVADGSAQSAINELDNVITNIKEVGHMLDLPGTENINYKAICSSMSDRASTQILFNKLLESRILEENRKIVASASNSNGNKATCTDTCTCSETHDVNKDDSRNGTDKISNENGKDSAIDYEKEMVICDSTCNRVAISTCNSTSAGTIEIGGTSDKSNGSQNIMIDNKSSSGVNCENENNVAMTKGTIVVHACGTGMAGDDGELAHMSCVEDITRIDESTSTSVTVHAGEKELRYDDRKQSEVCTSTGSEEDKLLLDAFCGMHLGVNLRAAQIKSINDHQKSDIGIDTIVHSTCKLLGHLGSHPEYGKGVVAFPEFLQGLLNEAYRLEYDAEELKNALEVKLARQVGSRYFVTSRNGGRIFYLHPFIKKFLESLQLTKPLNNLEKVVLAHMTTAYDLALLKLDGLLCDKVYSDLMCLLKSKKLNKSLLCMNQHYLELLNYLKLLTDCPMIISDPNHKVYISEPRLYKNPQIAAKGMSEKLSIYKSDQLHGGKFWAPSEMVKAKLESISPTNDTAESALGLNDWLHQQNPNCTQRTLSTMVEVMKNSTMTWFQTQDQEIRDSIINLARQRSKKVVLNYQQQKEKQRLERYSLRQDELQKAQVRNEKAKREEERLNSIEITQSSEELDEMLLKVQSTTPKKTEKAELMLLRDQIRIRTNRKVPLTIKGKKRSTSELKEELLKLIEESKEKEKLERFKFSISKHKRVKHRLKDETTSLEEWYNAIVIEVSDQSAVLKYEEYNEELVWSLSQLQEDIANGDLKLTST